MITPAHSRGARGILDWTQSRLAAEAGVSLSTVRDFEAGRRTPIGNNLGAIKRALESAGVEFTNGDKPGVQLARAGAPAASAPSKPAAGKAKAAAKPPRGSRSAGKRES
jgi:transcriptional regulator with XRE-family HTH domain